MNKINKILETLQSLHEYQKIDEATVTGNRGTYKPPIRTGIRKWFKDTMGPYTEMVSPYIDSEVNYDSLDGEITMTKKEIQKREKQSKKVRDKDYRQDAPDEGDDEYAPAPFKVLKLHNTKPKTKEKINEDLGVWFGTKKKPKGSKQPKGPWVNICRKKEGGGHPPCGRPEADSKGYPKCRAAGVASKMTDAQKKSACAQKRRAEKTNPKTGTGNKPKMVSYKPKKKTNESIIISLIRKSLD